MKSLAALLFLTSVCLAQENIDLMSNQQIADRVNTLAKGPGDTGAEQMRLVWILLQRSGQGDKTAHKIGRPLADKLREAQPMNPRAKFAYGYFRVKEGLDTGEPVTRKRRLDDGRRPMGESLTMGSRDPDFLTDAGILLAGLPTDVNFYKQAINSLVLAKKLYGEKFNLLSKERQADWNAAIASGFDTLDLTELAREHFLAAVSLAPDTPSGRKAAAWLRSHGG